MIVEEPNLQSVILGDFARTTKHGVVRRLYLHEAHQLERLESAAIEAADTFICASSADLGRVKLLHPGARVELVHNGVDTDYIPLDQSRKTEHPTMLFLANFNHFPNLDGFLFFAKNIFPQVQTSIPTVRLRVVGYHADRKLASSSLHPNVEVFGYTEDTRSHLAECWLSVCPLRFGNGSSLKILESMAAGTPVISTPTGFCGLPVEPGKDLLGVELRDMGTAIVQLLNDGELRQRIALRARQAVESRLQWKHAAEKLDLIYAALIT